VDNRRDERVGTKGDRRGGGKGKMMPKRRKRGRIRGRRGNEGRRREEIDEEVIKKTRKRTRRREEIDEGKIKKTRKRTRRNREKGRK
jgi:hypothetical protein